MLYKNIYIYIEKARSKTASVHTGLTRASIRIGIKFHVRMLVKSRKFQAASVPKNFCGNIKSIQKKSMQ